MHRRGALECQAVFETPADYRGFTAEQRDMLDTLEKYVEGRRNAGDPVEWLGISTGTWLALGKPEIAAGVRVVPVGPQTALPDPE